MVNENGKLESWDEYLSGEFLKAVNVTSPEDAYVCTAVEVINMDGEDKIRLTVERNTSSYLFDLNKTNAKKAKELGVTSPKAIVGKKIYFIKVLVRNPKTNTEVESLRISKIE